jgi:hypothetical protein
LEDIGLAAMAEAVEERHELEMVVEACVATVTRQAAPLADLVNRQAWPAVSKFRQSISCGDFVAVRQVGIILVAGIVRRGEFATRHVVFLLENHGAEETAVPMVGIDDLMPNLAPDTAEQGLLLYAPFDIDEADVQARADRLTQ